MTRHSTTLAIAAGLLLAPLLAYPQTRPTQPAGPGGTQPPSHTVPTAPPASPSTPVAKPQSPALAPGLYILLANQFVASGNYMVSQNRKAVGIMQTDGRFCIYAGDNPAAHGPVVRCFPFAPVVGLVGQYHMELRADGNLCLARGVPLQASPADTLLCVPGQPPKGTGYAAGLTDAGDLVLTAQQASGPGVVYWSMMQVPQATAPGRPVGPVAAALKLLPPAAPPVLGPGGLRVTAPSLAAYAVDASGKRNDSVAPPVTCPGPCTFVAPAGTRVEIASSSPVRAWTGECATQNASTDRIRKCVVTMRLPTNNTPVVAGVVLQ